MKLYRLSNVLDCNVTACKTVSVELRAFNRIWIKDRGSGILVLACGIKGKNWCYGHFAFDRQILYIYFRN